MGYHFEDTEEIDYDDFFKDIIFRIFTDNRPDYKGLV